MFLMQALLMLNPNEGVEQFLCAKGMLVWLSAVPKKVYLARKRMLEKTEVLHMYSRIAACAHEEDKLTVSLLYANTHLMWLEFFSHVLRFLVTTLRTELAAEVLSWGWINSRYTNRRGFNSYLDDTLGEVRREPGGAAAVEKLLLRLLSLSVSPPTHPDYVAAHGTLALTLWTPELHSR